MALSTGPNVGTPQTILLRVNSIGEKYGEAVTDGTVTPGDLIRLKSSGNMIRHDQAGKYARALVAIEDTFQGRTIDNDYVATEVVRFFRCQPEDEVYANLAASQYVIPNESYLASNGDGKLKVAGTADTAIAVATPDAILTSLPTVQRCPARVLEGASLGSNLGTTTTTSTTTTT